MWALRRAANPLRRQSHRIVIAHSWVKSDNISGRSEYKGDHDEEGYMVGRRILPAPYSPTFSARSSLWCRNLSSKAGAESNDSEDILEDRFSGLETPPENDKVKGVVDKDVNVGLEEDICEDEPEETIEGALGLEEDVYEDEPEEDVYEDEQEEDVYEDEPEETIEGALGLEEDIYEDEPEEDIYEDDPEDIYDKDVETNSNADKKTGRRYINSPLFKILVDTPRSGFNFALDKWVSEGKPLGRAEITSAMINLRRRRLFGKALQFFDWLEANKRLDFMERDYASYLGLIGKVHGIQKAEKYIEKIPESFRGEVVYRTLLAKCVARGNVKKSEEVFNKIRDLEFSITTFACNQLLLLYKRKDRKKIADILELMEKENVNASRLTCQILIDAKGRENNISGMEEIVEMMKAEGVEPNLRIHAMLARCYIYGNHKEKAEAELKEIEGYNLKDNRAACRELLLLYGALGRSYDVGRIWKVCEKNPGLGVAAIEAWGKLGQIENAERVFELMVKMWKNLSSRLYCAMIKVYAQHKLLSKGKDLAKRMSDDGCWIGPVTWDALVKLYVEAGEVEKADSLLQKAVQHNQMRPLYSSYMIVLEQYAKRGDIHNAEKIFRMLRQHGYTGRLRSYQTLLQAYTNAKAHAYGFKERMKADNMFPNKLVVKQLAAVDRFKKTQISELLD